MFKFFVTYGSEAPVTVVVHRNSNQDASAASGNNLVSVFQCAYARVFGYKPNAQEIRFFLDQVRQRESLEAQPQSVGL